MNELCHNLWISQLGIQICICWSQMVYGREMNIRFSGGHSSSQHANCTLPEICGIVLNDKTAHFSGLLLSPAQGAPV